MRDDLSDDIKAALRPVVVELYQTLQACKDKTGYLPETLYLTGGLTHIRGLRAFLESELHVQTLEWPVDVTFAHPDFAVGEDERRSFGLSLALAQNFADPKPWGGLNFRRTTNPKRKLITEGLSFLSQPRYGRPLAALGAAIGVLWIYSLASALFLGLQASEVQRSIVGEFRRIVSFMGQRAQGFVNDPVKTREAFEQIERSRARKQDNSLVAARSSMNVLLDVSDSLPQGLRLDELRLNRQAQATQLRAYVQAVEGADASKSSALAEQLKNALSGRGYSDLLVQPSGPRIEVRASWKGGSDS